jgi:Transposase IS116/IS110/IS902 family
MHAMRHMAFLAEETEALDQDIATLIREANLIEAYELLQTIPGIKSQAAATILAESGPDMKQFPTSAESGSDVTKDPFCIGLAEVRCKKAAANLSAGARYEGRPEEPIRFPLPS